MLPSTQHLTKETSSEGSTSQESTPSKSLSSKFKFPAEFTAREFECSPDSSWVKLTSDGSQELFDEFIELNSEFSIQLTKIGGNIYFDDLFGANGESAIHESAAVHLTTQLTSHAAHLGQRIGAGNLFVSTGNELIGGVGTPDVSVRLRGRGIAHCLDPDLIVEVCYSVSLSDTHAKIQEFFANVPGLMAAVIVHIYYDWRTMAQHDPFLDYNDGKLAIYYYERPREYAAGQVVRANFAVSFGNDPLTDAERTAARGITGVPAERFVGHFATGNNPPCTAPNMPMYRLSIPAAHLLADDPADPLAGAAMAQLLQTVGDNGDDLLALHIDLYELKRGIIFEGVFIQNVELAREMGVEVPPLPLL